MSKINKIKSLTLLFDTYKNLLTNTQINVFTMYYLEDLSLSEIANHEKKSRSAISDSLKKTEEKLLFLESNLNFCEKKSKVLKVLNDINDEEILNKIKDIM